ncbi:MAG: 4Fe-4S binding protein [Candidatus Omnitrophota bacterium]|nr:4Fe-4S binding protein [Candidatus Omnitrophota bacterium]
MAKRKIISIDEKKCNGCGLCLPNCPEGAIQIINHKARLISDLFCDGLGACIGHCPQGAITIEEREAVAFDHSGITAGATCPGSRSVDLRKTREAKSALLSQRQESELGQWPVQLRLVPVHAPYFEDAQLLIAADCVPFAYANFHQDLLKNKILLVGCPKLDDVSFYEDKLKQIFTDNNIKSITYAHMEVPCCLGLLPVIAGAITSSGKSIPLEEITISIKGEKIK